MKGELKELLDFAYDLLAVAIGWPLVALMRHQDERDERKQPCTVTYINEWRKAK